MLHLLLQLRSTNSQNALMQLQLSKLRSIHIWTMFWKHWRPIISKIKTLTFPDIKKASVWLRLPFEEEGFIPAYQDGLEHRVLYPKASHDIALKCLVIIIFLGASCLSTSQQNTFEFCPSYHYPYKIWQTGYDHTKSSNTLHNNIANN